MVGGPRGRRTGAILLVEDNPDDEALTLRAFRQNKLKNEIVVKRDGAEALEFLFGASPAEPQLVLLDLKLPKVDGLEVLRRIRDDQRTSLLPVVILTSSKAESDLLRGYEMGVNSYIRKPVDLRQFTAAAREIGMYWRVLNETPPPPSAR